MPPSAHVAAQPDPFAILAGSCTWCGRLSEHNPCSDCRVIEAAPLPPVPPLLGRVVSWRAGLRRRRGIVAAAAGERAWVLGDDGQYTEVQAGKTRIEAAAPLADFVKTEQGALLAAATGFGVGEPAASRLRERAADFGGAPITVRRAAAEDFTLLEQAGMIPAAGLEPAPTIWHSAVAAWRSGGVPDAARMLLDLPAGRYPQRLALWMRASLNGRLPDRLREPVAAAVRTFDTGHPAVAAASAALLHRLGHGPGAETVVAGLRAAFPDEAEQVLDGEGNGTAAELLRALATGRGEPELLAHATEPFLDAIATTGRVPPGWAERSLYLRARTDAASLSDDEVAQVGADAERARRAVLAGKAIPGGVSEEIRSRFRPLAAALGGDGPALLEVAASAGFDAERLREAVAGQALPPADLLDDESLASLLLRCVPAQAAIDTDEADPAQAAFAARLLLRRSRELLYAWDWQGAYRAGLHVLRLCDEEAFRDEAQSLMAAALWQLGEDEAAIAALESALGGEYSAALQANLAVVAAWLEPELTAEHLARMVAEAPNLELRVAAGVHAARIWQSSDPSARGSDIPEAVLAAVRPILFEPMEYEDFTDLIRLMSQHDMDWLAGQRSALRRSPHADSAAARVWMALAQSLESFTRALATELRRPEPEPWVADLGRSLTRQAQEALLGSGGGEGGALALALLQARVPMDPAVCVVLFGMVFEAVLAQIDPARAEPSPGLIDAADHAAEALAEGELDERLRAMGSEVLEAFVEAFVLSRTAQLNQILDQVWPVAYGPPRSPDSVPADLHRMPYIAPHLTYEGRATLRRFIEETRSLLDRLRPLAAPSSAGRITALHRACTELERKI